MRNYAKLASKLVCLFRQPKRNYRPARIVTKPVRGRTGTSSDRVGVRFEITSSGRQLSELLSSSPKYTCRD
jgi:hypothetical protein